MNKIIMTDSQNTDDPANPSKDYDVQDMANSATGSLYSSSTDSIDSQSPATTITSVQDAAESVAALSVSDDSGSCALQEFTLFPKLALELRSHIWYVNSRRFSLHLQTKSNVPMFFSLPSEIWNLDFRILRQTLLT